MKTFAKYGIMCRKNGLVTESGHEVLSMPEGVGEP